MIKLISFLLSLIKIQQQAIEYLIILLVGKNFSKPYSDQPVNKPYRKLQIDKMPIIQELEKLAYLKLLVEYSLHKGKELKPVKHRANSSILKHICCPWCNVPNSYLYDNTGGRG